MRRLLGARICAGVILALMVGGVSDSAAAQDGARGTSARQPASDPPANQYLAATVQLHSGEAFSRPFFSGSTVYIHRYRFEGHQGDVFRLRLGQGGTGFDIHAELLTAIAAQLGIGHSAQAQQGGAARVYVPEPDCAYAELPCKASPPPKNTSPKQEPPDPARPRAPQEVVWYATRLNDSRDVDLVGPLRLTGEEALREKGLHNAQARQKYGTRAEIHMGRTDGVYACGYMFRVRGSEMYGFSSNTTEHAASSSARSAERIGATIVSGPFCRD